MTNSVGCLPIPPPRPQAPDAVVGNGYRLQNGIAKTLDSSRARLGRIPSPTRKAAPADGPSSKPELQQRSTHMALRDGLKSTELDRQGFQLVDDDTAKHVRHNSWRHRCRRCGGWFKQTTNGLCKRCLREEE